MTKDPTWKKSSKNLQWWPIVVQRQIGQSKFPLYPPGRNASGLVRNTVTDPDVQSALFYESRKFESTPEPKAITIKEIVDCNSKNTVICNNPGCNKIYFGQSHRELKQRFS